MTILKTDGYYKFVKTAEGPRGTPTHDPYNTGESSEGWCVLGHRWMKSRQVFSKTPIFIWFDQFEEIAEDQLPTANSAIATKKGTS